MLLSFFSFFFQWLYMIFILFSTPPSPPLSLPCQPMAKNMKTFQFLMFLTNLILSLLSTPHTYRYFAWRRFPLLFSLHWAVCLNNKSSQSFIFFFFPFTQAKSLFWKLQWSSDCISDSAHSSHYQPPSLLCFLLEVSKHTQRLVFMQCSNMVSHM